jgi:hypothetical protein
MEASPREHRGEWSGSPAATRGGDHREWSFFPVKQTDVTQSHDSIDWRSPDDTVWVRALHSRVAHARTARIGSEPEAPARGFRRGRSTHSLPLRARTSNPSVQRSNYAATHTKLGDALAALRKDAEGVLKKVGLKPRRGLYILEQEESDFGQKYGQAQALFRECSKLVNQKMEFEAAEVTARGLDQQIIELDREIELLNIELRQRPPGLNNLQKDHYDGLQLRREAFTQAKLDLRRLIDATMESYAELAKNEEVNKALDALGRTTNPKLNLGPSPEFLTSVKLWDRIDKSEQLRRPPRPAMAAKKNESSLKSEMSKVAAPKK